MLLITQKQWKCKKIDFFCKYAEIRVFKNNKKDVEQKIKFKKLYETK